MDLGDFLAVFPPTIGSGRSSRRPPEEQTALAIACGLFPIVDFVVVLFLDDARHMMLAALLPLALALVAIPLARRLGAGTGATVLSALGCVFFGLMASGIAVVLSALSAFYSGF